MKKRRSIIAIALALVMLSGCSSGEVTQALSSAEETPVVSDNYDTFEESSEAETSKNTETSKDKETSEDTETSSGGTSSGQSGESGSGSEENEWKETPVTGTKYITEDCYSRIKAIIGSDSVETHTYGSSVKVVAKTDTGYFKLEDGTFIHQDYLSDSKPTQTEPPKTTVKPQTQKPASGSTDKTDGYTWVIQPQYNYDDVVIAKKYGHLCGEAYLCKPVPDWDGSSWVELQQDKEITGIYQVSKNNKKGMVNLSGNLLADIDYDYADISPGGYFDLRYEPENLYEPYISYSLDSNYNLAPPNVGFGGQNTIRLYNIYNGKVYYDAVGYWDERSDVPYPVVVHKVNFKNEDDIQHGGDENDGCKVGLYYNGKLVIPLEYDYSPSVISTYDFEDNGYKDLRVVFVKNNKIYVFGIDGKCYSNGEYSYKDNDMQETIYFNGYLPVCKNNKWGLIDTNGKEVISCQFEDITSVYDGKAWAKQNGKWGVISLS